MGKARELLHCCDQVVILLRRQDEESAVGTLKAVLATTDEEVRMEGPCITTLKFNDPNLEQVSSSAIRRYLVSLLNLVPLSVLRYIVNHEHLVDFYVSLYNEVDVQASLCNASDALKAMKS